MTERSCSVSGCGNLERARGWCPMHYQRWRHHGDPLLGAKPVPVLRVCTVEGCEKKLHSKKWCTTHHSRWRRTGDPESVAEARIPRSGSCSVEGCESSVGTSGMCNKHYTRWRKYGDVNGRHIREAPNPACPTCGVDRPLVRTRYKCSECAREYSRRWRAEREDELKVKRLAYYAANRRQILDQQFVYAEGRREAIRSRLRDYYRAHPELFIANAHLRKARELAAICVHGEGCVSREVVADTHSGECLYCGAPAEHADHYIPLAKGGLHCRENLVPACSPCNRSKHAKMPEEWLAEIAKRPELGHRVQPEHKPQDHAS